MNANLNEDALGRLRQALATAKDHGEVRGIIEARDQVLARYSPMFQPDEIGSIEEEALRSFFYFENNRHWTSLYRQVNRICTDIDQARRSLSLLVDETKPLETRLPTVIDSIKGMGPGIATAILHVAYPNRYGVWNKTSESGMVAFSLMPSLPRGASSGERYARMNEVFRTIAQEIGTDLWTLDALWWLAALQADDDLVAPSISPDGQPTPAAAEADKPGAIQAFGLERHLQDFLFDNWDATSLGTDWKLFTRPGEPDAGYEFSTPIGRIDLLARHRTENRWLVIELKRNLTSDQVVGQVLRYMGWIGQHLAEASETVEGLVIAQQGDTRLQYAVSAVPSLSFMGYEVDFRLTPPPGLAERGLP